MVTRFYLKVRFPVTATPPPQPPPVERSVVGPPLPPARPPRAPPRAQEVGPAAGPATAPSHPTPVDRSMVAPPLPPARPPRPQEVAPATVMKSAQLVSPCGGNRQTSRGWTPRNRGTPCSHRQRLCNSC